MGTRLRLFPDVTKHHRPSSSNVLSSVNDMEKRIKQFPVWVQGRFEHLKTMYQYSKMDPEVMEEAMELFRHWDEVTPK